VQYGTRDGTAPTALNDYKTYYNIIKLSVTTGKKKKHNRREIEKRTVVNSFFLLTFRRESR